MNGRKSVKLVGFGVLSVFSLIVVFCLHGLYQSANGLVGSGFDSYKTAALLGEVRERLREAKSGSDARIILRTLDTMPQKLINADQVKQLHKIYDVKGLPGGVEDATIEANRIDLFSEMFNFYRQLVVQRSFGAASVVSKLLRQGYKNISATAKPEAILAFTRLVSDRLDQIEGMIGSQAPWGGWVRNLRQLNANFETSARARKLWKTEGQKSFTKAESVLTKMVGGIAARSREDSTELQQRFLILTFVFLLATLLAIGLIYMFARSTERWFDKRIRVSRDLIEKFGLQDDKGTEVEVLQQDKDWSGFYKDVMRFEEQFLDSINSEVAIARSIQTPLVVLSPANHVVHWNSDVTKLLQVRSHKEVGKLSLREFFKGIKMQTIAGIEEFGIEDFEARLVAGNSSEFQLYFIVDGTKIPCLVRIDPITEGFYANGYAVCIYDLREEDGRVSERVADSLKQVFGIVSSMNEGETVDFSEIDLDRVPERSQEIIESLRDIQVERLEREELWRSEIEALISQVSKQDEFIGNNRSDITVLKNKYVQLNELLIARSERLDMMESSLIELQRRLASSDATWRRVVESIERTKGLETQAVEYESHVKAIREEMFAWYSNFEQGVESIRKCREWVKLQSVNVNIGDSEIKVFRDRARKFAFAISEFYERVNGLKKDIKGFIDRHPGSAVLSAMKAADDWDELVQEISGFYNQVRGSIESLSSEQEQTILDFTKIKLLQDEVSRIHNELMEVNDKSSLVNTRTREALDRWG